MALRRSLLTLVAFSLPVVASGSQLKPAQSDDAVLMQIERNWDAAVRRHDSGFIGTILADEFMATYDDGSRADRTKEIVRAATFDRRIDSSTLDDFTIKVYGDTAVVWFTQSMSGTDQGRATKTTLRYLDVFVFRAGRWQCVASQSTKMAGS
jgi:ketosteroid isomerase-like protein